MNNKNIKCGIVGFGKIGQLHYSVLKSLNLNIVGICDKKTSTKKKLPKSEKNIFFDNFDKMIKNEINFLIISTTADYHSLYAKKAAANKVKYILIEKPVATSLKDCRDLKKIQKKFKCKICVNHTSFFQNHFYKLSNLIKSKHFGKITSIVFTGGNMGLAMNGVHIFDLVKILTNEKIEKITSFLDKKVSTNPRGKKFKDRSGVVIGQTKNRKRFFMDISSDQGHGRNIKIICEYGEVDFNLLNGKGNYKLRKKEYLKFAKTKYGLPEITAKFKFKIVSLKKATFLQIKNFLSGKKYTNLKEASYSIKIILAANMTNQNHLISVKSIKSKKKYVWA